MFMKNDKKMIRDELRMSDLTIEEIDKAENRNLNLSLKAFPNEVVFYYEVRWLYENLFKSVPDESIPMGFLFKESGHCFMFGFQQLLRCHLVEAASSLRKAVESCSYAITMGSDFEKTKLWILKDNDPKKFGQVIDQIKWKHPKTKPLKVVFDFLSNYSGHANFMGQIQKFVIHDGFFTVGYFDVDTSDPKVSVMRQLNHCLDTHIKLLMLYGDLFDEIKDNKKGWDQKISDLSRKFKQYKISVKSILDP